MIPSLILQYTRTFSVNSDTDNPVSSQMHVLVLHYNKLCLSLKLPDRFSEGKNDKSFEQHSYFFLLCLKEVACACACDDFYDHLGSVVLVKSDNSVLLGRWLQEIG